MEPISAWFYFGGAKQYVLDNVIAEGAESIRIDESKRTIQLRLVGNAATLAIPIYKRRDFSLRQGDYRTLRHRISGTKGTVPDMNQPSKLLFSLFDDRVVKMVELDKRLFAQELERDRELLQTKQEARKTLPAGVDPRGIDQEIELLETSLEQREQDGMTLPAIYLSTGKQLKVVEKLSGGDGEVVVKTGGEIEVSADCADGTICFVQWPVGAADKAMYIDLGREPSDPMHIQVLHRGEGRYCLEEYRNCTLKGQYADNQPEYRLLFSWQSREVIQEGASG